jgi:WD40 repeat protein
VVIGPAAPATDRRGALEAFDRAIAREAYNLLRRPELCWQQLCNRLQWEDEQVTKRVMPELERRAAPGATPWMRLRAPLRESAALVRTMGGDGGAMKMCAVAPDASFILTTSEDGVLRVWDPETGQMRAELAGMGRSFSLSPDGSRVFASEKVWELATGRDEVAIGGQYFYWGTACAWVPGRSLLVSVGGKSVNVWNADTGRPVRTLRGHASDVTSCAVSPDGSFIVSGGGKSLKIWDTDTGELHATLKGGRNRVQGCAVSPGGSTVASCGNDAVRLWKVATGEEIVSFGGELEEVLVQQRPCAFSPDGRFIAAADSGYVIRVWDLRTTEEVATLEGHADGVEACAFSPDGSFLASAGRDGTLRLWNPGSAGGEPAPVAAAATPTTVPPERSFVEPVWPRRGKRVVSFRSLETGAELAGLEGYAGGLLWGGASSDRSVIVSSTTQGLRDELVGVEVWDARTGAKRCSFQVPTGVFSPVGTMVSPEGSYVVSFGGAGQRVVVLWDSRSGRPVRALVGSGARVSTCAVSPDGSFVVTGDAHGALNVWDAAAARVQRAVSPHSGPVAVCAISPEGSFVASVGVHVRHGSWRADSEIRVTDIASGGGHTLRGHDGSVMDCAVSPDARLVLSAGADRTLRCWEARTGRPVAMLPLPDELNWVHPHPWGPLAACGYATRQYLVDLAGVEYGPLAVTAVDRGDGPSLRCPACDTSFPLDPDRLGATTSCPGCGSGLRVAPRAAAPWFADAAAPSPEPGSAECKAVRRLIRAGVVEASAKNPQLTGRGDRLGQAIGLIEVAAGEDPAARETPVMSPEFDRAVLHVITCDECKADPGAWLAPKPSARRKPDRKPDRKDGGEPTRGGRLRGLLRRR